MDNQTIASIFGFVLFSISEILAFIPVKENGIIQTIVLQIKKCLNKQQDIEVGDEKIKLSENIQKMITDNAFFKNISNLYNIPDFDKFINNLSKFENQKNILEILNKTLHESK